jgi:peptide deformylase
MELVYYPHDILRQTTQPVDSISSELKDFLKEMVQIMDKNRGVGLAAPQVGNSQRFFVAKLQNEEPIFFINPEVLYTSLEKNIYEEGCLSLPGVWAEVKRPAAITIQALNLKGKVFRLEADGFLARVIQHELDHLNGILFFDHLSEKKRELLLEAYQKVRPSK